MPDTLQIPPELPQIKGSLFDKIAAAAQQYQPGTLEFFQAIGIDASQKGIVPSASLGPLHPFRMLFSPDARALAQQQKDATEIGWAIVSH